jgi:hypothetical protein
MKLSKAGIALVVTAAAGGAGAQAPVKQVVTGPVAEYWVSAETISGMAGMMSGGKPSPQAMMSMMMNGGPKASANHNLTLQLGSSRKAAGPSAQHTPSASLGAQGVLPLVTPTVIPPERGDGPDVPQQFEKPRGKILLFWGCGAQTRQGQPAVLDMSKLGTTKSQAFAAAFRPLSYTAMKPPSPQRHATYGVWPNERSPMSVPPSGSLVGEHKVSGNYTPDIRFNLNQNQDFLAPITLQARETPAGASLNWNAVAGAKGFLATAVGGGDRDTVALWISSEAQAAAFIAPDYLSQGDLARLVEAKQLMGPQTTTCALPKGFVDAAPNAMVSLVAYGGEANFSHPPRPTDPKAPWNIEWTTKVRYRSATGAVLGMDMSDMGGMDMAGDEDEEVPAPRSAQQRGRPQQPMSPQEAARQAMKKGLGGLLGN